MDEDDENNLDPEGRQLILAKINRKPKKFLNDRYTSGYLWSLGLRGRMKAKPYLKLET